VIVLVKHSLKLPSVITHICNIMNIKEINKKSKSKELNASNILTTYGDSGLYASNFLSAFGNFDRESNLFHLGCDPHV
jgi:hypothetical protein